MGHVQKKPKVSVNFILSSPISPSRRVKREHKPQLIGQLAGRHATHEADRNGEMTSFSLKRACSKLKTLAGEAQYSPGDNVTQLCPEDFKQALKQQVCDVVSDPDFGDEPRLRPDFNRLFFCDPVTYQVGFKNYGHPKDNCMLIPMVLEFMRKKITSKYANTGWELL